MIGAKVIKHSISEKGKNIYTIEAIYPRYIHGEVMTHRAFTRNGSSSRAIPTIKIIKEVWSNPVGFVFWGKNKPGMKATEELKGLQLLLVKGIWYGASKITCVLAYLAMKAGAHKQTVNRMLEPYSSIKTLITTTEFNNFFALRDHPDAQPEIRDLAIKIKAAVNNSVPQILAVGEWHLPYLDSKDAKDKELSASLCAQVSFRSLDFSAEKAKRIFKKLVGEKPVHASPTEHQATPLEDPTERAANFIGWRQFRTEIPGNVVNG